jgi:alanine dehydrogenase
MRAGGVLVDITVDQSAYFADLHPIADADPTVTCAAG